MEDKNTVLVDLRNEIENINIKIKGLLLFRTEHFMELDSNHLCLLDIQLNAMRTYSETLSARIILLEGDEDGTNSNE